MLLLLLLNLTFSFNENAVNSRINSVWWNLAVVVIVVALVPLYIVVYSAIVAE